MASLKPPFTHETATKKVKAAQGLWNTQYGPHVLFTKPWTKPSLTTYRDPTRIAAAYTPDSIWRNRTAFFTGTEAIIDFLTKKWKKEQSYRLRKELFSFTDNRIAVQFWYEYQDAEDGMKWKRCYGLEDWTFDSEGKMRKRMMSGNDVVLGVEGNGEGRWFVDGVDVEDVAIGESDW